MKPRRQDLWRGLVEATLASITERGYPATTIRDITERAGVNRTQFYFLFEDKEECFLAVQRVVFGELEARLGLPSYDGLEWPERMKLGVDAVAEVFDEEPAIARLILLESPIAGPLAQEQHRQAVAKLMPHIDRGREMVASERQLPSSVGEMALGSVSAVLTREIQDRDLPNFTGASAQIYFALIMPFLGPNEAMDRARHAYPDATEVVPA